MPLKGGRGLDCNIRNLTLKTVLSTFLNVLLSLSLNFFFKTLLSKGSNLVGRNGGNLSLPWCRVAEHSPGKGVEVTADRLTAQVR